MKQTNLAQAAAPIFAALQSSGNRSVSVADTAKLVRAALKDSFPGTKFSVRSDSYSMGAAVRVSWVDGPTIAEVDAIVKGYEGADFDGMIDMKSYSSAWLSADGKVSVAHAQGTEGSRGCHPEVIGSAHNPNALEVHFGADYVTTSRDHSPDVKRAALAAVLARYGDCPELATRPEYVVKTHGDHSWLNLSADPYVSRGNAFLSCLVNRHLSAQSIAAPVATATESGKSGRGAEAARKAWATRRANSGRVA